MATPLDPNTILEQIRTTATELGVDPDFATRIATKGELTTFDPNAKSNKGAFGIMQVMPGTAKELEPRYGKDNIRQGVGYLRDLGEMFQDVAEDQRPHFIAAAYNAGPTRILDLMEKASKSGADAGDIASLVPHLPEETVKYLDRMFVQEKVAAEAAGQNAPPAAPQPATTPQQRQPRQTQAQSFGEALWGSLAHEGERQRAAFNNLIESFNPNRVPENAGVGRTLLGSVGNVLEAASPFLAPTGTLGGVGAETLARMGMLGGVSPETAQTAGSFIGGLLPLGPGGLLRGARAVSPGLRTAERGAKGAKALKALEAERIAAGTGAKGVVEDVGKRLQGEANVTFKTSEAVEPGALRLRPTAAQPERVVVSPIVDEFGRPIERIIEGKPARILTEKDYGQAFRDLRKVNERAGQAAIDFDRQVSTRLSRLGPHATSRALGRDPDLANALLLHATPNEAAIIQRAITSGQPLSKLALTEGELGQLGKDILAAAQGGQGGILSTILHWGIAGGTGAGLGYFAGGPVGLGTVLAARLALKAADAALGSRYGVTAMRALAQVEPGSQDVIRILAGVAGQLTRPQKLEPLQQP